MNLRQVLRLRPLRVRRPRRGVGAASAVLKLREVTPLKANTEQPAFVLGWTVEWEQPCLDSQYFCHLTIFPRTALSRSGLPTETPPPARLQDEIVPGGVDGEGRVLDKRKLAQNAPERG